MRLLDIVAGNRPPAPAPKPAKLSERVAHAREVVAQTDTILDDLDAAFAAREDVADHMLDDLAAYAERVKQQRKPR